MELRNTTLDDISAVIGFSATLRLVAWFGDGSNLYVPITAEDGCLLVRLLGLPAARRLCEAWPGEHLAIPRLRDHEDDLRKRFVARMIEKGFGTREIAGNSHGLPGNWDQSKYMLGLYNGIELSLAILSETDPKFRELPDQIIEEIS
jgi:hypothetical protein